MSGRSCSTWKSMACPASRSRSSPHHSLHIGCSTSKGWHQVWKSNGSWFGPGHPKDPVPLAWQALLQDLQSLLARPRAYKSPFARPKPCKILVKKWTLWLHDSGCQFFQAVWVLKHVLHTPCNHDMFCSGVVSNPIVLIGLNHGSYCFKPITLIEKYNNFLDIKPITFIGLFQ